MLFRSQGKPGEILPGQWLTVACGQGSLMLTEVQPEGKKKMSGEAYACGLGKDTILGT